MLKKKVNRDDVFSMFGGRCAYCGNILGSSSGKHMHVDHVEPIVRNWWDGTCMKPKNERQDNYFPSCPKCNINKSSLSVESFRNMIKDTIRQLERSSTYQRALRYGMVELKQWDVLFYFEKYVEQHNK